MIRIFSHYVSKMAFILLLLEMVILLVSAALVSAIWLGDARTAARAEDWYLSSLAFALVIVFSMSTLGMYQHRSREDIRNTLVRIMPSFALGFALLSLLFYMVPTIHFARGGLLAFLLGAVGVLLTRLLLFTSAGSAMLESRLILVGAGPLARECIALAASKVGYHQFTVVGCVDVPGEECCVTSALLLPGAPSLLAIARRYGASEIVVSVNDRRNGAFPARQLLECALGGVRVIDAATFFEREACQIRIDSLQPSYLTYGGGFDQSFVRATSKRIFDLAASAAICVAALPVMLAAALWIRCEDGGPVFYQQERVGKDGKIFKVLKFRSMRKDAEGDGKPIWAAADDPRVTRVGQLIRKLRIDELPQMLNVFRGEMSFVGPRPERAYFVEQLKAQVPYYDVRHSIKPGVTGLAQVRYQYGASVDDAVRKLQYDLYYVKNNSLFLDLLILLDTVQVVLFGQGSR
ncbi:TIGR03013 family XrtA/PEP-CTERM system glycosyltransferase [Janthinobacterium fluminis]|uniref:TIGR03013 family PEP-CTERM/XrtA system glycosyltransferase n=1 Tax=Janthinobacterium fluminis TaxID=2987524 RepID=A0ABT5JXS3_9BURK|nr:TIGR03013 family XrtA/PEP-CTERM system glycosyltransferase [Janthinobacterium fluminis]MDC8756836.1 TIGR03013 family PEP-CTERM/XrtA system glycosyltransferase [Janthinobacterium fluminis]